MRRLILFTFVLLWLASPAQAQVAFDAVAHSSLASAGTSIPSFNITIGAGVTNGAVVVGLTFENTTTTGISVTVGGNAASLVASTTASNTFQTMLYCIATGSTHGATAVVVSWTGSVAAAAGAISFSGVDQATPCNNGNSATATTTGSATPESITITSTSGDLTFDWNTNNGPVATTSPNQMSRFQFKGADFLNSNSGSTGPGTGTATHTWTYGTFEAVAISGVNMKAASGGGGGVHSPGLLLLGVGGRPHWVAP